jgi:predicted dehydrogenase
LAEREVLKGRAMQNPHPDNEAGERAVDRREFCARAGAAALSFTVLGRGTAHGSQAGSRIRLGVIGCGGRGAWVAALFQEHGGYEISAAADYFQDRVDALGAKFGVAPQRRFTGLSGYRRLLDAGVDAVAIETPPYFHPEQAEAAVAAGAHVYLAKPVAVDVPGCRTIGESARGATQKGLVFLVDFQTRANPLYMEAVSRIHQGALGDIVFAEATYHADCPFEQWYDAMGKDPAGAETRMRAWGLDRALSGDIIVEQDVHTLDVMSWVMGRPPVSAVGGCGLKARPRIGTCSDHFVVLYEYSGGVRVQFSGRQFKGHGTAEGIRNRVFGSRGVLEAEYGGQVLIRGESFFRGGKTSDIYREGAASNIAAFHEAITSGDASNPTAAPSVQSTLVGIMGRNAAYSGQRVTWEAVNADQQRLSAQLDGLRQ